MLSDRALPQNQAPPKGQLSTHRVGGLPLGAGKRRRNLNERSGFFQVTSQVRMLRRRPTSSPDFAQASELRGSQLRQLLFELSTCLSRRLFSASACFARSRSRANAILSSSGRLRHASIC